jgi:hypothetical protein
MQVAVECAISICTRQPSSRRTARNGLGHRGVSGRSATRESRHVSISPPIPGRRSERLISRPWRGSQSIGAIEHCLRELLHHPRNHHGQNRRTWRLRQSASGGKNLRVKSAEARVGRNASPYGAATVRPVPARERARRRRRSGVHHVATSGRIIATVMLSVGPGHFRTLELAAKIVEKRSAP